MVSLQEWRTQRAHEKTSFADKANFRNSIAIWIQFVSFVGLVGSGLGIYNGLRFEPDIHFETTAGTILGTLGASVFAVPYLFSLAYRGALRYEHNKLFGGRVIMRGVRDALIPLPFKRGL